jgi:hypothetical protein
MNEPDAQDVRIAQKCHACRGYFRPPETDAERAELWGLCRATGGNIMCPHFRAGDPCNSGWEAETRAKFRPLPDAEARRIELEVRR